MTQKKAPRPVPRGRTLLAALTAALLLTGAGAAGSGTAAAGPARDDGAGWSTPGPQRALSGVLSPGPVVRAQTGPTTPAPRAGHAPSEPERPGHRRMRTGPDPDPDPVRVPDVSPRLGGPLPDPGRAPSPGGPGRLALFRDTTVPVTTGVQVPISEPSTDQLGRDIFATGNRHAEFSRDNGRNWTGLDPRTVFGPSFCCDQVTKTDARYHRQHWLLQYLHPDLPGGHGYLVLANSAVGDFVNWRPYTIRPSAFGYSDDLSTDYNDVVIGDRYLYLTTRIINYDPEGNYAVVAVALMRVDRADLAAGRPAHYDAITRTDITEELRVPQGITDVAYAAATSVDSGRGRRVRLLVWPENSPYVTTVDRSVPAFRYMTNEVDGAAGDCSSRDGVVNDWCAYFKSGAVSAARARGSLWLTWPAQQYGTQRPFPYVRLTVLRESDLRVVRNQDLYSRTVAHAYQQIAPDERGNIGYLDAFGGGTGNAHYFPGAMIGVFDDITPASPSVDYFLPGKGNACVYSAEDEFDGNWGDYLTIRGLQRVPGAWIATAMARKDNTVVNCGADVPMTIKNIVFGRERDRGAYERSVGTDHR
ncbi:hypothetical protein ACFW1F_22715 [Streptomyces bungoensis]|uniref:hypothetical protein n=1 Tax=Streptomyces bungoensis TaxID=285568 RepID=UPI0034142778